MIIHRIKFVALSLLLLLSTGFVAVYQANAMPVSTLFAACSGEYLDERTFCEGYIGGMFEGIRLSVEYDNYQRSAGGLAIKNIPWCLPPDTSFEIAADAFIQFLINNSGFLVEDVDAQVAVYAFFNDEYGCEP